MYNIYNSYICDYNILVMIPFTCYASDFNFTSNTSFSLFPVAWNDDVAREIFINVSRTQAVKETALTYVNSDGSPSRTLWCCYSVFRSLPAQTTGLHSA